MATTYEWSFPNFETDADNKVKVIHWRYTATEGDYTASMYGCCSGSEGMSFDTMTKDNVIDCVIENQSVDDMQSNLSAQIEKEKTPEKSSISCNIRARQQSRTLEHPLHTTCRSKGDNMQGQRRN